MAAVRVSRNCYRTPLGCYPGERSMTLADLGLDATAERAYRHCLRDKTMTAAGLAEALHLDRAETAGIVRELVRLGLVRQVDAQTFEGLDPAIALENLISLEIARLRDQVGRLRRVPEPDRPAVRGLHRRRAPRDPAGRPARPGSRPRPGEARRAGLLRPQGNHGPAAERAVEPRDDLGRAAARPALPAPRRPDAHGGASRDPRRRADPVLPARPVRARRRGPHGRRRPASNG